MIRFTKGNLLTAPVEALVNTVNEVGVMGKGIARMFRDAFPASSREYEHAAKAGQVQVGRVFVTVNHDLLGPRLIIHFPTKKHWRNPSRIEWVRAGLVDLRRAIKEHRIKSLALPPLGCGNGGLAWNDVRHEIERALSELEGVDILVFEPTVARFNAVILQRGRALTSARAMVTDLVRRYSILGLECSLLEVQKLAWFLERVIVARGLESPLGLRFSAGIYGPYSDRLRHLLQALDGSYLRSERPISDAKPFDAVWFDESRRSELADYLESVDARAFREALEATARVIEGFESPLGLELLATVDWLLSQDGAEPSVPGIRRALAEWPGGEKARERKARIFDDRLIGLALERLTHSALGPLRPATA